MHKGSLFFMYGAGIFTCYFYFGILQEKITRGKYVLKKVEDDGSLTEVTEKFTYMLALCAVQCTVNFVFAKGMLYFWPQQDDKTRKFYYASSALTYLLAMVCSNMALQWVPYPTQVVGKAAKPIPVMILGVLLGNKSYPTKKYLFVFLIVIGIVLFMFKDNVSSTSDSEFGVGELLLFLSLTMDGLTGAVQERMRSESPPSAQHMMRGMNSWSCCYLLTALLLSGEGVRFIYFASRHSYVLSQIAMLALAGALGQLFILLMVAEFGPLPCSIVTTTRKFFTVLGSVLLFGNALMPRQWMGAILVFTGLFLDAIIGKQQPKKK